MDRYLLKTVTHPCYCLHLVTETPVANLHSWTTLFSKRNATFEVAYLLGKSVRTKAWKCHFGHHFVRNFVPNFIRNYL